MRSPLIAGLFRTAAAGHWYGSGRPDSGADAAAEPSAGARTV
ncbi:hypothetical protein ACIQV3_19280 [Streptomyces sp. NPDC099050]